LATTCINCGERPATTTWGFPVCQRCCDGLECLHKTLNDDAEVEPDPVLVDLFARPSRIEVEPDSGSSQALS
jgi:hypothetical protein